MDNMIAYCGLDCAQCDAYIATINDDQALREKTAALWAELNSAPILPAHINCMGCRKDGVKTVFCEHICAIRSCAAEKAIETCGDCARMADCERVAAIHTHRPEAYNNLRGGQA